MSLFIMKFLITLGCVNSILLNVFLIYVLIAYEKVTKDTDLIKITLGLISSFIFLFFCLYSLPNVV